MESHRYSMSLSPAGSDRKNRWRRILQRYRFDNAELEALYQRYIVELQIASIVALLALFLLLTAVLGTLNFVFVGHVTVRNIYHISQSGITALILVYIHSRFMKETHMLTITCIVWVLCISFCIVALPVNFGDRPQVKFTPAEGVWQVALIIFLIYALLPLKIYFAMMTGILLPIAHVVVSVFFAKSQHMLLWRQVTANLILFAAVNIAGVYIHDRSEHAQRKAFLDTRNCIAARLDMEDENERLEKLLLSVLPQHVAMEMKAEMLSPNGGLFHSSHIQKYDHVSILFADIVGFTSLAQQCSSHELVKILNEIVSKFDSIAEDNHCLRIKMLGDNYFCVSGLPEARNDHAQCAVTMGIDMIDVMAALREATDVDLETRIGIHTGSVVTGVIGLKKWQYDAWSDDVITAYEVQLAGTPGRVHVSRAVVDHLRGTYQAEPAQTPEKNTYLHDHGLETFHIVAAHPRKCLSLVRQTNSGRGSHLRNMQNPVLRLLAVLKFSAEPPFAHVYRTLRPTDDGAASRPVQGQIGDITKKPYKKRTSLQRPCADRVNGYLANAITTRSVKREKRDHVNLFTLRFKRSIRERMYQSLADTSFATSMLCTLIMLVCVTTVQAIVLPRTLLLLALFLVTFSWVCVVLIIVLGTKLRCCGCNVQKSWSIRLIITLITVLLIYAVAQVNVFCCRGGLLYSDPVVDESMTPAPGPLIAFKSHEHLVCEMPEYIYISGVLGYIAMAVFFKMAAIVKLCLMLIMAAGYLVLIEFTHIALFTESDRENNPDVPSHVGGILALLFFVLCLYVHSRHQEWTYRLDFLWKNQATMEKIDTTELQNNNRQILCNLLPAHVAAHFVEVCQRTNLELFSQAYQRVGVIFISMPNFVSFYTEMSNERRATEALQVLQNIVADFDELLHEDRFRGIDKIKTCGTVYMAAVGLSPERMIQDDEDSISGQLSVLMEFYFSMRAKLQYINENAGYSFQLRAGAHIGPLVAAVVGARRPQFDLFGNTINLASTMETTGHPDQLQVTDDIYQPLVLKYEFLSRGPMPVKHMGTVSTYFLVSRKTPYSPMSQPMMPSLTGLAWKDGVQLRNPAKRMSIHEMINRRSRPVSFHLSRENVNQMAPSLPGQMPGSDSPLLSRAHPGSTPTGSLNRKRSDSGPGGSGGGSRDNMPRPNESPFQNLSSLSENPGLRVESPELPVVHFRNVNMQGSDSLGRTKEAPSNSRNLTQSQILHARCESRCQSRGSISSRNDTTSPLTTAPLTTDGVSSGYSPTTSPSSLLTSPESPANNLDWKNADQTFGSDHSRYENATDISSPMAKKLMTPPRNAKGSLRENVYENVQNDLNIVNGGPSNVNKDDLAALNNIIKDIGPSDKSFGYEHNLYQPEQYNHANGYSPILSVNQYLYGGSGSRGARPKTLATTEEQQNLLPSHSPVDSGQGHPLTAAYLSKLCLEPYRRPPDIPCSNKPRKESVSSSSEPMSPIVSSSSMCTPSSPLFTPDRQSISSRRSSADAKMPSSPESRLPPASPGRKHSLGSRLPPAQLRLLPMGFLQKQHSLPEANEPPLVDYRPLFDTLPLPTREGNPNTIPEDRPLENHTGTYPPEIRKSNVQMEDKGVGTDDRHGRRSGRNVHRSHRKSPQKSGSNIPIAVKSGKASPPPLPPPPPEDYLPPPKHSQPETRMVGPLSATNTTTQQALVFVNPANCHKPTTKPYESTKLLGGGTEYSAFKPINASVPNSAGNPNDASESPRTSSGARPKHKAVETTQENPDSSGNGTPNTPSDISGGESTTKRPPAPPFQVKRRQKVQAPPRLCRSLDYIPSDLEDALSVASRPDSPDDGENSARSSLLDHFEGFPSLSILTRHLADNISLSSVGSSEMSRSDPALNYDSASTAYESEYDNYRPGMASDEDYFVPDPISDIDIDMFDDINVDDVTVSDTYSLDLPLSLMHSNLRLPDKEKKVTDV